MDMTIKEKLLISAIASTLALAIGSSAWAFMPPHNANTDKSEHISSEKTSRAVSSKKEQPSTKTHSAKVKEEATASQPVKNENKKSVPSSNLTHPEPYSVHTKEQTIVKNSDPRPTPAQPRKVTCDESAKASYTSLYNSQKSAENAQWASRVNGFSNEATRRGMSFSGYVQDQINQHKPAHDARLASIDATYQANLSSINCN